MLAGPSGDESLLDETEEILLRRIVEHYPDSTKVGAALLGVTPPTYRRRVAPLVTVSI